MMEVIIYAKQNPGIGGMRRLVKVFECGRTQIGSILKKQDIIHLQINISFRDKTAICLIIYSLH